MSHPPNPYAAPSAKVDDGSPTAAERRKRFRRRIIWGLTILGAGYGAYAAATDPIFAGHHSGFVEFSRMFMPFGTALEGAFAGWLISGVLWHVVELLRKLR